MAANYLHGVETIEIETGPRPVKAVKSAVIGLIGTAPCGPVNQPTLCLSESDAAQFGPGLANFTIPQALKAIYDHGAGTVVVINVLNPAVHKSTIPSETVKVDDNGQIQLKHGAVQTINIGRSTNAGNAYIKGTDYTIDMLTGKITCMGTNLKPGVQAYVNYTYADPTKVTAADIIGAVNTAGDRTGMKLLQDTWNQFGFYAKILIAPVFCTQNSVAVKLIAQAEALGAITYIDAPIGTTFQQVLAGRGPQGRLTSIPVPIARVCAIRTLKCTTARRTAKSWSRSPPRRWPACQSGSGKRLLVEQLQSGNSGHYRRRALAVSDDRRSAKRSESTERKRHHHRLQQLWLRFAPVGQPYRCLADGYSYA